MAAAAAGLWSGAGGQADEPTAKKPKVDDGERRTKLYPHDSVACQFLNPYGSNSFDAVGTAELWKAVARGGKKVAFHSELAAEKETGGDWSVGVGISRYAETMLGAITQLKQEDVKKLLAKGPYEKAMAEAIALESHFQALHAGKGSKPDGDYVSSIAALKRGKAAAKRAPTEEELKVAVEAVYAWARKDASALRAVLSILAGNGAFWSGYASEKTFRAAVAEKPLDAQALLRAACERASGRPSASAGSKPDDIRGLF